MLPTFAENRAKLVNNRQISGEIWFLTLHFSVASKGPEKKSQNVVDRRKIFTQILNCCQIFGIMLYCKVQIDGDEGRRKEKVLKKRLLTTPTDPKVTKLKERWFV